MGEEEVLLFCLLCGSFGGLEKKPDLMNSGNREQQRRRKPGKTASGELMDAILTAAVGIILSVLLFKLFF